MLRDLYNLRVYRNIGEDALHSRAVRLASGFQEHLELSGLFFRASCRHCIEDAKSPQEDRAIGSEARAPILLNWGEGLICNCWFAFPNSLSDTPMAYNGTWVVTVMRMGSELGGACERSAVQRKPWPVYIFVKSCAFEMGRHDAGGHLWDL